MATISPIHPFTFPRVGILGVLRKRSSCIFERLPTEIIVDIMLRLDDLASLDCLLHASPVAYRIFDDFAINIIETILGNGYGASLQRGGFTGMGSYHVPAYAYIAAEIRSGTIPLRSLTESIGQVILPSQFGLNMSELHFWEPAFHNISPIPFTPQGLRKGISPAVVRSLVATSRHLTSLSVDCVKIFLDRFKSLRPSYPDGEAAEVFEALITWEFPQNLDMAPWIDDPKGEKVCVQDSGPPTWVEEQRVLRAFWCLQLIVDIRKAATSSSSRLRWSPDDVAYLSNCKPTDTWTMEGLLGKVFSKRDTLIRHLASSHFYKQIMAVMHYIDASHGRRWPAPKPGQQRREVARDWPAPTREAERSDGRADDLQRLASPAEAPELYVRIEVGSLTALGSYAPYNALGFAVWEDARMRAAGLLPSSLAAINNAAAFVRHRFAYAWLSVLGWEDENKLRAFRRMGNNIPVSRSWRHVTSPRAIKQEMLSYWLPCLAPDFGRGGEPDWAAVMGRVNDAPPPGIHILRWQA
ncbi:hypothetical protein PG990_009040 [Apiospora arundinis]